jgi:hypothetical protein
MPQMRTACVHPCVHETSPRQTTAQTASPALCGERLRCSRSELVAEVAASVALELPLAVELDCLLARAFATGPSAAFANAGYTAAGVGLQPGLRYDQHQRHPGRRGLDRKGVPLLSDHQQR